MPAAKRRKVPFSGAKPSRVGFKSVLDNVFFSQRPFFSLSEGIWNPPADVYETADTVVIKMEVAGVDPADLAISTENDLVLIRGCREENPPTDKEDVHLMELHYGHFERAFRLPAGKLLLDEVQAQYQSGFLFVTIPKKENVSREIPIRVEE